MIFHGERLTTYSLTHHQVFHYIKQGTSDEHISIVEILHSFAEKSAIIVTTPQAISLGDVRREITFCQKVSLPIVGLIENMSGFICPTCTVFYE